MLRTPFETIERLPFLLKSLAVARPGPELRLLKKDGIDALINHRLYMALLEVFDVILGRNDIGRHLSMPYSIAIHRLLTLVEMPSPVPFAREVILIFAPGDARHEVSRISVVAPRPDTLWKSHVTMVVGAIYHDNVRTDISGRFPLSGSLKCCFLLCVLRIACNAKQGEKKKERGFFHNNNIVYK